MASRGTLGARGWLSRDNLAARSSSNRPRSCLRTAPNTSPSGGQRATEGWLRPWPGHIWIADHFRRSYLQVYPRIPPGSLFRENTVSASWTGRGGPWREQEISTSSSSPPGRKGASQPARAGWPGWLYSLCEPAHDQEVSSHKAARIVREQCGAIGSGPRSGTGRQSELRPRRCTE